MYSPPPNGPSQTSQYYSTFRRQTKPRDYKETQAGSIESIMSTAHLQERNTTRYLPFQPLTGANSVPVQAKEHLSFFVV